MSAELPVTVDLQDRMAQLVPLESVVLLGGKDHQGVQILDPLTLMAPLSNKVL